MNVLPRVYSPKQTDFNGFTDQENAEQQEQTNLRSKLFNYYGSSL